MAAILNLQEEHEDYLRDESRMAGYADSISFPRSEQDICDIVSECTEKDLQITTQGARTGLTGGAVPQGGVIINTSKMTEVTGLSESDDGMEFFVAVQPGIVLAELRKQIESCEFDTAEWSDDSVETLEVFRESGSWFFPPDPTETSAALGGMLSCNASGAQSFFYGPTRDYIEAIRVVLPDGSAVSLRRGVDRTEGRRFSITTEDGKNITGDIPHYQMPNIKNAAGYYAKDNMDLIDLFIGAEGTLGIVSEIVLRLVPTPAIRMGVVAFLPNDAAAVAFDIAVKQLDDEPAAIEYFDCGALNLLRAQKDTNPAFEELPAIPEQHECALYVEYHGNDEEHVDDALMGMSEALVGSGGSDDATWIAMGQRELERLKAFRHAVPEAVNLIIDERRKQYPELTKLGTDMAVPGDKLAEVLTMYRTDLAAAGLEHVMFGHMGSNHVHVNIIPNSPGDYDRGKSLYLEWAGKVVAMGGTVSAEHGIGKLKVLFLQIMYGEDGIADMRNTRRLFDPKGLLNTGNLFE